MTDEQQRQPCPRNRAWFSPDWDQTFVQQPMVPTGFNYNASLQYLPYHSFPLFVSQLDELTAQRGHYRARWLCVPDGLVAIDGPGNFDSNEHVNSGSIVYGFSFAAVDGNTADFEVGVGDVCSGHQFFEGTIVATALRPGAIGTATGANPVLIEPYEVQGEPHPQLDIRIRNKATASQRCQLIVHLAEPCAVQGDGPSQLPRFPWSLPAAGGMRYGGA